MLGLSYWVRTSTELCSAQTSRLLHRSPRLDSEAQCYTESSMPEPIFKRILLKISGEAWPPRRVLALTPHAYTKWRLSWPRCRILVFRWRLWWAAGIFFAEWLIRARNMDRVSADQMGMLATVINALALQDALEKQHVYTRVQTAIEMNQVAEPFIPTRRVPFGIWKKGAWLFLLGAREIHIFRPIPPRHCGRWRLRPDAILKATKVDGIYDADPMKVPDAKKFDTLTYMDVLKQGLKVMDSTAISFVQGQ